MEDILATKLFIPSIRPDFVSRPRLVEQLKESLNQKLTLISAPTGFGKTSLLSEWITKSPHCVTWLSLNIEDNDFSRFWTYFIMSLQVLHPDLGQNALRILHSAMTPSMSSVLSSLINDLSAFPDSFISVLDDYHVIESTSIDESLTFFLDHQPPNMHLVITTREDPNISLGRLRAQGQLNEIRINDLRFTSSEASELMNTVIGLKLSSEHILSLNNRTEGWAAGLKLAAISMRGKSDHAEFIRTFTGSNRYIMDYLVDEVLSQQSETIKNFLLNTSILDRLCGPLCDAVMANPAGSGQKRLEELEQANLFIIPLDNERKWYRYHNLFADLLRQRLMVNEQSDSEKKGFDLNGNHMRASQWFEDNGFEIEAFEHAAATGNLERTLRLMEGNGLPLHYRGAVKPVLNWLKSLPNNILNERPNLWVSYASVLMLNGQTNEVEAKLNAAESALESTIENDTSQDIKGSIAAMRASLAVNRRNSDIIMEQSRLALEYLDPENRPLRIAASWTLGYAYQLKKNYISAEKVYKDILETSQPSENTIYTIASYISLGQIQEANNQLFKAETSYRQVLQLAGDPPMPFACEAYLGLARIFYQWNNLEDAEKNLQQSLELTRQLENVDTPVGCYLLSAQINLAKGDLEAAETMVEKAQDFVNTNSLKHKIPEIVSLLIKVKIQQNQLEVAKNLAEKYAIRLSKARVLFASGKPAEASKLLKLEIQQAEENSWTSDQINLYIFQAIVDQALNQKEKALQTLIRALTLAEPENLIRAFVDEGKPLEKLLSNASLSVMMSDYVTRLKTAIAVEDEPKDEESSENKFSNQNLPIPDQLSQRELEILQLIAQGLSNRQISEKLYLTLNTIKGHNQKIFRKLQVNRRTEAIVRARELELL